jgi:hypothetical protein
MAILSKFPSQYLKGDDIEPGETVTIKVVRDELVGMDQESKPVLYLDEYERGIVLNKTNARSLVKVYGDDETTWPGKKIVLHTEAVSFRGETTNAIRMQAAAPARRKKEAERVADELSDEIPY